MFQERETLMQNLGSGKQKVVQNFLNLFGTNLTADRAH